MKFAYEDLNPSQFEELVVLLCQRLLGSATQGFAAGPDGGRDAKFEGVANGFPSETAPWSGISIIQAKHTLGYNGSFSETDFFSKSASNSVVHKEIPRIKKLRISGKLDHYMLFANRRLTGNADSQIRDFISDQCDIPSTSVFLCGVEQLELWMRRYPEVAVEADLDPVDSPLIVSPDDLAEVVEALAKSLEGAAEMLDDPPADRITYDLKNKHNKMTDGYARAQINKYLKETEQIRRFLASPENAELLGLYELVIDEFQLKILAKRREYQTFDEVMEHLISLLFARDAVLRQRKHMRLTRAILFYMYWNCDIGEVPDATTD